MITIAKIIEQFPNGHKFGGIKLTVKSIHKNDTYTLIDKTGSILAAFNLKNQPKPERGNEIKIAVAIVTAEDTNEKSLYIDEYSIETRSEPLSPYEMWKAGFEPPQIVRGKIMCWLVAAFIQSGKWNEYYQINDFAKSKELKDTVDRIMEG